MIRKVALSLCAVLLLVLALSAPSGAQMAVSFNYHVSVNVHATINLAAVRFQGAQFHPVMGTPSGRMTFLIGTTGSCNLRMFARVGMNMVPVFDSGPIFAGVHSAWVDNVRRGDFQEFVIVSHDCFGNLQAQDRLTFWTPPPEIVTTYQWEQITLSRRTVRVGFR